MIKFRLTKQHQSNLNLPEFSGFEGQYFDEFRPEMRWFRHQGQPRLSMASLEKRHNEKEEQNKKSEKAY